VSARRFPYHAPAVGAGERPERETADALLLRAGEVLLERRPDDARVAPGLWDSPGGHLEPGETPAQALARELAEELGITVTAAEPFAILDEREEPGARLRRHHVFVVRAWSGEARSLEGRRIAWLGLGKALALEGLHPLCGWCLEELVLSRG